MGGGSCKAWIGFELSRTKNSTMLRVWTESQVSTHLPPPPNQWMWSIPHLGRMGRIDCLSQRKTSYRVNSWCGPRIGMTIANLKVLIPTLAFHSIHITNWFQGRNWWRIDHIPGDWHTSKKLALSWWCMLSCTWQMPSCSDPVVNHELRDSQCWVWVMWLHPHQHANFSNHSFLSSGELLLSHHLAKRALWSSSPHELLWWLRWALFKKATH